MENDCKINVECTCGNKYDVRLRVGENIIMCVVCAGMQTFVLQIGVDGKKYVSVDMPIFNERPNEEIGQVNKSVEFKIID